MDADSEEEDSEDVLVRKDEPLSLVVKAVDRLGILADEEAMDSSRRDPDLNCGRRVLEVGRGVRNVTLNSSSSSSSVISLAPSTSSSTIILLDCSSSLTMF